MGHATTWSEDEDIILADSWIAISCDPIKSNQQGGETFWERIFALFSSKLMKKHVNQLVLLLHNVLELNSDLSKINCRIK